MITAHRRKLLKNAIIYYCVAALVWLLQWLPHRLALSVGRTLGRLAHRFARKERARALDNLLRADLAGDLAGSPDRTTCRRIAREMAVHLGQNAMECVVLPRIRPKLGTGASPVSYAPGAREALRSALEPGAGVVFVTAHLGNWELMAAEIARVAPVSVLRKRSYDPRFTEMIDKFRVSSGVRGIEVGRLKPVLAALAHGQIVGILLDQPVPNGCQLPFMGRLARTSTLPARIHQRTGAAVVTGFIRRVGAVRHEVCIDLICKGNSCSGLTVEALTLLLSRRIEQAIRRAPAQWIWSLDRWRSAKRKRLSSPGSTPTYFCKCK